MEHDLSSSGDVIGRMTEVARLAIQEYGFGIDSTVELLNVSENATFVVRGDTGDKTILRVHRLGYHTVDEIESELDWMQALRVEASVHTPKVLPSVDGRRVVSIKEPRTGRERQCVMFEFLDGEAPQERDLESFERLGSLTAKMHQHARGWSLPRQFKRFHWDIESAFGSNCRWGRWQEGLGVGDQEKRILQRLEDTLRQRLLLFGKGPDRYGLIHADTRLANLLITASGVSVIDFDDCGFSWYLYDLASAVSFFEDSPQVPELIDRWLRGYRAVASLPAEDEQDIWTFILFRRLLLVAWIGSHGAAEIAQQLGVSYTVRSCELAEKYLSRASR